MQEVTVERSEHKVHIFHIPNNIKEDSDEWNDIMDNFDWSNVGVKHASETVLSIKYQSKVTLVSSKMDG